MVDISEQSSAPEQIKNNVVLSFHPAYNSRHFDADYGRRYHCDPIYRIETDIRVAKGLYQEFGEYGMGDPDPKPELGVGVQPLDFMNAAMGGKLVFKKDASVETPDKPLSWIKTIEDMERLSDIDWNGNPLLQNALSQVEQMKQAYPEFPINHVQGVWQEGLSGQKSFLTMHTPYTTAFRLFGQEILELMLLDEKLAQAIFDWLMRQYHSLWEAICKRMDWHGTKVHFGDCAATMLAPKMYERMCLPLYEKLMQNFEESVIHSCGQSGHLLELFAQVPKVGQLQLGHGTDLSLARRLFPGILIVAYYEPYKLISDGLLETEREMWKMAEQLENNFEILCGATDPDTPQENIYAFLKTAREINQNI